MNGTIVHYAGAGSTALCAAIVLVNGVSHGSPVMAVIGGVSVVYLVAIWRKAGKSGKRDGH